MKNLIKPIRIINEPGLNRLEKDAFFAGLKEILHLAGVYDIFMKKELIKDFGTEKEYDYYNNNGMLVPHQNVEWFLQDGDNWSEDHKQLNIEKIVYSFYWEPWREDKEKRYDHYDVMIVHSNVYDGSDMKEDLNGISLRGFGAIISTYKLNQLKDLDEQLKLKCIETITMHEIGHMFGLLPKERTENVYEEGGLHCNNMCVMKQGRRVPGGYPTITEHRLKHGAFCSICERDLKAIFKANKNETIKL